MNSRIGVSVFLWATPGASVKSILGGICLLSATLTACSDSSDDGISSGGGGSAQPDPNDSAAGGSEGKPVAGVGGLGGVAEVGGMGGQMGGLGGGFADTECSSPIAADVSDFVELCELSTEVGHVRIEGLLATQPHTSTQLGFGFEDQQTTSNPSTGEGELKILFYGGASPAPPAQTSLDFGDESAVIEPEASYLHEASTVCFDVHSGSDLMPPKVVLWRSGENGADCSQSETLTLDSAVAKKLEWEGSPTGAINAGQAVYFRQSASGAATVTLLSETMVSPEDL